MAAYIFDPLNSMNIKVRTRIVCMCLPPEVPLFDAVKERPGLLVMDCQVC